MDDPAFMLLQLQENLRFLRTQSHARVLSCVVHDQDDEPHWTYVLLTYDNHGNVQEYHEPSEGRAAWTDQPLEALRQLHLRVAGLVANRLTHDSHPRLRTLAQQQRTKQFNKAFKVQTIFSAKCAMVRSHWLHPLLRDPPRYISSRKSPILHPTRLRR
jgi:hypothetical protein